MSSWRRKAAPTCCPNVQLYVPPVRLKERNFEYSAVYTNVPSTCAKASPSEDPAVHARAPLVRLANKQETRRDYDGVMFMTSPVQLLYEEREIIMYWLIDEDQLGEELCLNDHDQRPGAKGPAPGVVRGSVDWRHSRHSAAAQAGRPSDGGASEDDASTQ